MRYLVQVLFAIACYSHTNLEAQSRSNYFDDPFGQVTYRLANCPAAAGPLTTEEEARKETHWRAERGTSCFRSGRCRLPNAYRYDSEIFPRVLQFIQNDGRFDDTSIWVTVQRRWVFVHGCVNSREQGLSLEAAVRQVDDVEAVIGEWMVGTTGVAPYEVVREDKAPDTK